MFPIIALLKTPPSYKEGGRAFSWLVDNRRIGSFLRIVDLSDLIIQRLPQDDFLRDYFPRDRNVCLYPWYYVLWFLETVSFNRQLSGIIKKKNHCEKWLLLPFLEYPLLCLTKTLYSFWLPRLKTSCTYILYFIIIIFSIKVSCPQRQCVSEPMCLGLSKFRPIYIITRLNFLLLRVIGILKPGSLPSEIWQFWEK